MNSIIVAAFVLLATSGACAFVQQIECGVPAKLPIINYIMQGDDAFPQEFPWQISLQERDKFGSWVHNCGGSIIDKDWVFTAGHCFEMKVNGSVPSRIVLGAHNITRLEKLASVQEVVPRHHVFVHPLFDADSLDYDYALIQLPEPLDFAATHSHLTPICMPMASDSKVFDNMDCMVSGWGLTLDTKDSSHTADILQKLPVQVPTQGRCASAWSDLMVPVNLTSRQMCVATTRGEGSGTCRGDSGGPLQCIRNGHWYLAGVCSFGIYCGSIKYPTIFSRTTEAVDWIKGVQDVMRRE